MALPQTGADPTPLTRLPREPRVSTTTSVHEALASLDGRPGGAAVVYRSTRPVGIVTAGALVRAAESGRAGAPVAAVMDYVAVPVDPHADPHATVRAFVNAANDWLHGHPG